MGENYDLAIIGAGPVGLYAGYFASLHGLSTVILESLAQVGGQPAQIYPAKELLDIPVFSRITGDQLTANLSNQLSTESATIKTNYEVETIDQNKAAAGLIINGELSAKSIIIATGLGAFSPKKLPLDIPESARPHFHYFIKDPAAFTSKRVAVLGGGDSALDWADLLQQNGVDVAVIHRRNKFRGLDRTIAHLNDSEHAELITPYLPIQVTSTPSGQIKLSLKDVTEGSTLEETFDEVLVAYGFKTNNDFVDDWGVKTDNGFIHVNRQMATNRPAIYAIGDAVTYESRVPIIALGFGEAQIAITDIMRSRFPEKKITLHSTSIK